MFMIYPVSQLLNVIDRNIPYDRVDRPIEYIS